jgi:hypothetical protein
MLGRGGGNDLSSTSIYPFFMLGRCRYCTFKILIANPINRRPESNYFAVNWNNMQLTTTKFRIYQVRCTCYICTCLVYYLFFLDRQFRGDVAILVFLKTMASYNPTSLTPSLFTEIPVLSQESEWSCICVLGISNLPISTIFLLNF